MRKATSKKTPRIPAKEFKFDLRAFLDSAGATRRVLKFSKGENVYRQGEPARSVKYIQEGGVRLSIINEDGKEAVVAVLGPGDFFVDEIAVAVPIQTGWPARHPSPKKSPGLSTATTASLPSSLIIESLTPPS